jgi:hypothetical protein
LVQLGELATLVPMGNPALMVSRALMATLALMVSRALMATLALLVTPAQLAQGVHSTDMGPDMGSVRQHGVMLPHKQ